MFQHLLAFKSDWQSIRDTRIVKKNPMRNLFRGNLPTIRFSIEEERKKYAKRKMGSKWKEKKKRKINK